MHVELSGNTWGYVNSVPLQSVQTVPYRYKKQPTA